MRKKKENNTMLGHQNPVYDGKMSSITESHLEYEYIDPDDMKNQRTNTEAKQNNCTTGATGCVAPFKLTDEYDKTRTDLPGHINDNEFFQLNTSSDGIMVENGVYELSK